MKPIHLEDLGHRFVGNRKRKYSLYKCKCGKEFEALNENVNVGNTSTCGCSRIGINQKHGLHNKSKLYGVWKSMRQRCRDVNLSAYKNYGGRGITVSDEWNDYSKFYEWSIYNGYKEGLEIDRTNNDGNYNPENCRFVTRTINARNRRNNKLDKVSVFHIKRFLKTSTLQEDIANIFGVSKSTICAINKEKIWN